MFKKRNIEKKIDVAKDIEDIVINQEKGQQQQILVPKSALTKKINKFSNHNKKQTEETQTQKKPAAVKYGLIDKDEVNSKYHANQQTEQQKHPQKQSIVNLYIKRKMEELAGNKDENKEKQKDVNAEQIMKMQKKYLQLGEQKLADYDIAQILKRLQNMATNSIKTEVQSRNTYLKNLLQNQFQKMQYASKKELKTIRQQKERMQQQFKNKYNDSGRRSYVQRMKYDAMMGK